MRTATIIGKTHDGKWKLLSSPSENLLEQRKKFRAARAEKSDETFSLIQYQENDGHAEFIRYVTPEQQKAREEQRAKDHAAYEESLKPKTATAATPAPTGEKTQEASSDATTGTQEAPQAGEGEPVQEKEQAVEAPQPVRPPMPMPAPKQTKHAQPKRK